ncbi:hypothetical protein DOY81_003396 [Sarcophaga bullata]|nr:hypothetical protein DOY81_003396 [Sarcophaga bullata]
MKRSAIIALIFHILLKDCYSSLPEDIANISDQCLTNSLETSLYCRGTRAINNIINNLSKTDKPIVIVRGLEIVPSNNTAATTVKSDSKSNTDTDTGIDNAGNEADYSNDTTTNLLERFSRYLQTHELNIKFSDLMSLHGNDESLLTRDLEHSRMQINNDDDSVSSIGSGGGGGDTGSEARKKDKGNGMIMALALMMSKMMAVMGLGGIGALAMKALGVAMTALMLAAMVGVKALAHQGNESTHSVQYVAADGGHHHRRRRRRSTATVKAPAQFVHSHAVLRNNDAQMDSPQMLLYRRWQK